MLSHMTRLRAVTMTALPILLAPACATLSTNVDPMARDAGVRGGAQVILYGTRDNIDNMTISQNDGRDTLKIVMVNNPTFGQVLKNQARAEVAKGSLQGQPAGTSASYTTTERISPAIYLDQKGTHTLHLVRRDGEQATVVTKAHVSKGVFAVDWLLFAPTLGTSLLIDWATGKWNSYDAIEVDKYFPTPMAAQSAAQQNPQR